jgi:uncharacterized protein YbjQ (UPF0145 family)
MKKSSLLALALLVMAILAGCTTTDYTANMTGVSDYTTVVVKDFIAVGIVTVQTLETHNAGPLGFVKNVTGSKVTYGNLMQEAAKLEADDIINVRIDINSNYKKTAFDWLIGWTRTYTYTGTALAIKYTDKLDTKNADPQLGGLPKAPEATSAVRTNKDGKVTLK